MNSPAELDANGSEKSKDGSLFRRLIVRPGVLIFWLILLALVAYYAGQVFNLMARDQYSRASNVLRLSETVALNRMGKGGRVRVVKPYERNDLIGAAPCSALLLQECAAFEISGFDTLEQIDIASLLLAARRPCRYLTPTAEELRQWKGIEGDNGSSKWDKARKSLNCDATGYVDRRDIHVLIDVNQAGKRETYWTISRAR